MGHEARIIKNEDYSIKPMALEEAVLQLNAEENDFYVFISSESGAINVIYRRKDGNYGFIEPEIS
jgi:putative sigma-54 modulation protein